MSDFDVIVKGLRAHIAADGSIIAQLGATAIYNRQAPDNTPLPYIIIARNAGGRTKLTPRDELDEIYIVKGVAGTANSGASKAATIAGLISARLDEQDLSLDDGWTAYRCQAVTPIDYIENVDRQQIYHRGWAVRVRATKE